MIKLLRTFSLLEGLSYLTILCVPLGLISRDYVYPIGMTHGALFMAYFIVSLLVSHKARWSVLVWLLVFLASLVPFAFVLVEMFLRKETKRMA